MVSVTLTRWIDTPNAKYHMQRKAELHVVPGIGWILYEMTARPCVKDLTIEKIVLGKGPTVHCILSESSMKKDNEEWIAEAYGPGWKMTRQDKHSGLTLNGWYSKEL